MAFFDTANQYYDLDAILADEELIPCVTQDDFSYLADLDPDASVAENKRNFLKQYTKLKLPLWAVESWAILGYCRCSFPRVFNNISREQYLLSNSNDASLNPLPRFDYFRIGKRIADVMQLTYFKQKSQTLTPQMIQYLDFILPSARQLQESLHLAFVGERFQQWLDWSWTSYGQDVSQFVGKLTYLEQSTFATSTQAWSHHYRSATIAQKRKRRQQRLENATKRSRP
ncbi:hypothetical protein ACA910_001579 [Epithemia clementina (nom. ined.)]